MKRVLAAAAILALLILPQAARAQWFDKDRLPKVALIYVDVADGVRGGCLPSPNVLKVEAELILRRSGIAVTVFDYGAHRLLIEVGGEPDSIAGRCVGSYEISLQRSEPLRDGTFGIVRVSKSSGYLLTRKETYQGTLLTIVNEDTTALANAILKARAAN